jgi:hypothetical protein
MMLSPTLIGEAIDCAIRFLGLPEATSDLAERARWHQEQAAECYRQMGSAP